MSDLSRLDPDDGIKAIRKLWQHRAKEAGVAPPPLDGRRIAPDAPPAQTTDPNQVRIGWYIPARHRADTFDTYVPQNDSQADALAATRAWVDAVLSGEGAALALVGGVGTGKSHLLYAAVRAVNEAGKHAAGYGWVDLADLLRDAKFGHDEDVTEARIKKARVLNAAALAIDEIRPTSGTDFDGTELAQLMTRAYRNCQGVIVTSNHADEKLARIVGLAAASRLTQVTLVGADMRKPENRRHLVAV